MFLPYRRRNCGLERKNEVPKDEEWNMNLGLPDFSSFPQPGKPSAETIWAMPPPALPLHLVLFEDTVDHKRRLLIHPLSDGMSHSIIGLQATSESLGHTVLIIDILLGIPGSKQNCDMRTYIPICDKALLT